MKSPVRRVSAVAAALFLLAVPVLALAWLGPWASASQLPDASATVSSTASGLFDSASPEHEGVLLLNNWSYTGHKDGHQCPPGQDKKPDGESKHCSGFDPGPEPPGHKEK